MIPNYDETTLEPASLLPKLPIMLLNGAEGIGTGFSSAIPSFYHSDIIASLIQYLEVGKTKKIKPYVNNFTGKIISEGTKYYFSMKFEEKDGKIFITELPRGYDAQKIYKYLAKYIEKDYLKDFIDSSVSNKVKIELIFKRGFNPTVEDVEKTIGNSATLSPNYTLISERGVKIFDRPEEIIEIFAKQRLKVIKRRYELLCLDLKDQIKKNNEIVKFIKDKQYEKATKLKNRKAFVDHLNSKKYVYSEYLADMPIYRMTKEEVAKRVLFIKEDKLKLGQYSKVYKSPALVKKSLISELREVDGKLTDFLNKKHREQEALYKKLEKQGKKKVKSKRRK